MIEMSSAEIKYIVVPQLIPDRKRWSAWFEQASALLPQSTYSPSKSSLENFFRDCISGSENGAERKILVAACDSSSDLVGFAQFRMFDREADLDFVLVDGAHRKKGIAKGLLQSAFNGLKDYGVTRVLLEVGIENAPALRLYQDMGFTQISLRKGYYRTGEDAALMELLF